MLCIQVCKTAVLAGTSEFTREFTARGTAMAIWQAATSEASTTPLVSRKALTPRRIAQIITENPCFEREVLFLIFLSAVVQLVWSDMYVLRVAKVGDEDVSLLSHTWNTAATIFAVEPLFSGVSIYDIVNGTFVVLFTLEMLLNELAAA